MLLSGGISPSTGSTRYTDLGLIWKKTRNVLQCDNSPKENAQDTFFRTDAIDQDHSDC